VDGNTTNEELMALVYEKLKHKKVLIIFDNVEDQKDVKPFLPKMRGPGFAAPHILCTSRGKDVVPRQAKCLRLGVLTEEECVQLILSELENVSDEDAARLADKLQRLPLTIQQALAYIKDQYLDDGDCVSKYLHEFNTSEMQLLNDERFKDTNDYSLTTFTTWQITLERIKGMDDGEPAIRIMNLLAYLNPDNISAEFVVNLVLKEKSDTGTGVSAKTLSRNVERGLKLLEKYSMLRLDKGKVHIHRLVQQVVRLNSGSQAVQALDLILQFIATFLTGNIGLTEFNRECMSHGLHLFPFQCTITELMKERSLYLSDLCYYLNTYGNYSECLSIAEQASSKFEEIHGKEHESTILMKWRQAEANHLLKNYENALQICQEIMPLSQSSLGENHQLTMFILSSMAKAHSALGDHELAIKLYDQAIEQQAQLYGQENQDFLACKSNKARALRGLGRLDEAFELYQEVHEKRVQLYGMNDFRTLATKSGIANVLWEKRELTKALQIKNEIYEQQKLIYGETHPDTLELKQEIQRILDAISRGDSGVS
jgi:tetratricopeptide (TPR) repeat protein